MHACCNAEGGLLHNTSMLMATTDNATVHAAIYSADSRRIYAAHLSASVTDICGLGGGKLGDFSLCLHPYMF